MRDQIALRSRALEKAEEYVRSRRIRRGGDVERETLSGFYLGYMSALEDVREYVNKLAGRTNE